MLFLFHTSSASFAVVGTENEKVELVLLFRLLQMHLMLLLLHLLMQMLLLMMVLMMLNHLCTTHSLFLHNLYVPVMFRHLEAHMWINSVFFFYSFVSRVGIRKAKSNSCAIGFTKSLFTVVYCYRISTLLCAM
jgi:hypothetical protein